MNWDLLVMLLALYNCITIPYTVAFDPDVTTAYNFWERVLDVLFALDLVLAFRTTFTHPKTGFEVSNNKTVAINYIVSGRFFVDLMASIPLELLVEAFDPNASSSTLKLFGLLKLVRLLRLGRIIRFMKFKSEFKIGIRLVQLLMFMFMLVHWIACLLYLMVKNPGSWVPPTNGDNDTLFYEMSMGEQYCVMFYYAVLALTGNDIAPTNTL